MTGSLAIIWTGENRTGHSLGVWTEKGQRYASLMYDEWYEAMTWKTSGQARSVEVFPGLLDGSGTACLIGFGGWSGNTAWPTGGTLIGGPFAQIHRMDNLGVINIATVNSALIGYFPPHQVILINTQRPNRFQLTSSIKGILDQSWPQIRDRFLDADPGLSVHSGPSVDWLWHEEGVQFLKARRPYVHFKIVFNYSPSGIAGLLFSDYKIVVSLFFNFSVSNGLLAARADRREYRVSPGQLQSYVMTMAELATKLAVIELNTIDLPQAVAPVNQRLQALNRVATDVFLLPGNQATDGFLNLGNTSRAGETRGDATLVLEVM